jgi:hypothetical protein
LTIGLKAEGALGRPASMAASAQAESFERLAEIDRAGGGKAIGALAEEDLVDVQLEDLVLVELAARSSAPAGSRTASGCRSSRVDR